MFDRRGARALGLAIAPRLGYLANNITRERTKNNLAPPPQTHVRKKLESRTDGTAEINLNGSRVGELESVSGPGRGV